MAQLTQPKSRQSQADAGEKLSFLNKVAYGGPGLVVVVNAADLSIAFVNHQFEQFLGYTQAEIDANGIKFTDLLQSYLQERFQYQLAEIALQPSGSNHGSVPGFVIYDIKNKTGATTPFYTYISPVSDEARPIKMYHVVMHPYSSQWNSPFTSFNTKELFLEHFNSEDFGTFEWIFDIDKIFWSKGLYRIYDADAHTHKTNTLFDPVFIHPNDRNRVTDAIKNAISNHIDLDIQYKLVTAKNTVKVIHCIARTLKSNEGIGTKFVGSMRDVTRQQEIEDDLKSNVEELFNSNKQLEEFAYIASHDLQEPLRKITTFSDRLAEKFKNQLNDEGSMYLSRIIASSESMRSLINDLLEFSRISKTQQPFERVNLNIILREVMNDLELTVEDTRTEIRLPQLPVIEAIGSQMKQLFTNIISNAIKFQKADTSPFITVETRVLSDEEVLLYELNHSLTYHRISVIDNGIGFEKEYAHLIFQVFQRLHGKAEYPGSGIGLAICKKIIEYHHGIIYAESIPDKGASFIFIIPETQSPLAKA